MNKTLIPNTNITLKEFKELLFEKFKAYPMIYTNYKKNIFSISETYYENISITQNNLSSFCNKLNINHKLSYTNHYSKCITINMN